MFYMQVPRSARCLRHPRPYPPFLATDGETEEILGILYEDTSRFSQPFATLQEPRKRTTCIGTERVKSAKKEALQSQKMIRDEMKTEAGLTHMCFQS